MHKKRDVEMKQVTTRIELTEHLMEKVQRELQEAKHSISQSATQHDIDEVEKHMERIGSILHESMGDTTAGMAQVSD